MERRRGPGSSPKLLLVLACACAFLSVFATFDSSEHYRAWKTARGWTDRQKEVAPAKDAGPMYVLSLALLADDTAVVVLSFVCALVLSVGVALDSDGLLKAARALALAALGLGLLYSAGALAYRFMVGARQVLKGPIFDYDMRLSPPVALAMVGYPACLAAYLAHVLRRRAGAF